MRKPKTGDKAIITLRTPIMIDDKASANVLVIEHNEDFASAVPLVGYMKPDRSWVNLTPRLVFLPEESVLGSVYSPFPD